MMQSFRDLDEGQPAFWKLNSAEGRGPKVPLLALINCQGAVLSASDQDHLETAFRRGGWQVYRLSLDDDWEHKLGEFTPDVLLVRSGAAGTASVTRIIRLVKGRGQGVCVAVQYGDVAPGLRIAALKAGADICFSLAETGGPWLAAELLAVVDAARRSRGQGLSRGWSLSDTRRTLFGPYGVTLPLTPIEGRFLARLFSSPGCCVRRGANAQGMQSRHMDVLVSRLRSKARRAGVDLPLHAVRHWGYIFLAELTEHP
ncbi:response regulator transcription factor [Bordetella holmesii]|uniref:Transcriptional regulator n=2 Tax=Bordetella holmesii TaxID=35814 RepID=A0ABN0S217_9BORD|nr:response regulator transcription factor [Bordetella holmesii]AHV92483.1 putative transcriptional regulator [Bordetella holmesii ATCC 51541]AIT25799.1 putative transcriptional regulator [Bordetella holmesii 44057]EWM41693.1 putative transcriptional regulator [Bordetella holmesii 41130]EWM46365.1 putative transcriptional regulator [Bordetella holmesii 35009]EWM50528.1 putative transcriptional regulator [Bordetella holmesii 70147]